MSHMRNAVIEIARAYHFAATRHVDHRRKGESAEPYVNHLTEVAQLVAVATDGDDPALVVAAILHDTIEDTATTREDLICLFGDDVAELVAEVTDDKSLPKQMRKDLQIAHAAQASPRAQIIKIADKISNLRSLALSPPTNWSTERIAEYGQWAAQVVDGCRPASPILAAEFDRALARLG